MEEAGLKVVQDGLAQTFGFHRDRAGQPALLMGSHSDTQPEGGWLDGALGVVYALEAARALRSGGCRGAWGVVSFNDEEGRFGTLVGSGAFVGLDSVAWPEELAAARREAKLADTALLRYADPAVGPLGAFFEAHIEQGPRMERDKVQIGVVSAIVGQREFQITFTGEQNHAGTTPMDMRRDAGLAAMRFALALDNKYSQLCAGRASVWTFGRLVLEPNAPSIVPGRATLTLQMRDPSDDHLDAMEAALWRAVEGLESSAETSGAGVTCKKSREPVLATPMDAKLMELIEHAAEASFPGNWTRLHSAALHDAKNLASVVPTAMMFVPSIKGISHNFDENTADEDIAAGARVFVEAAAAMLAGTCGD